MRSAFIAPQNTKKKRVKNTEFGEIDGAQQFSRQNENL
jgi:hypothetical protein